MESEYGFRSDAGLTSCDQAMGRKRQWSVGGRG